jgi:predicted DNA-binding transcriptional regulator AlpA
MSKLSPAHDTQSDVRFLGARQIENLTSISRWTLWRWEREGKFPRSLKLESKRAWIESEVHEWMAQRVAERG